MYLDSLNWQLHVNELKTKSGSKANGIRIYVIYVTCEFLKFYDLVSLYIQNLLFAFIIIVH